MTPTAVLGLSEAGVYEPADACGLLARLRTLEQTARASSADSVRRSSSLYALLLDLSAGLRRLPDSRAAEYAEWFAPGEGVLICDPEKGLAAAGAYFRYTAEGKEPEVYRLYKGAGSAHLEDGLAGKTAEILLKMAGTEEEANP